jgi:hypothetical protein
VAEALANFSLYLEVTVAAGKFGKIDAAHKTTMKVTAFH